MRARTSIRRLHIWLTWLAGVPLLLWTVSGLWMAARPIDEVRGTVLRRKPPQLVLPAVIQPPKLTGPVSSLTLEPRTHGPIWIARFADGRAARADVATGRWLPSLDQAEARAIAQAIYVPVSSIKAATLTPGDKPPLDLRQRRPAWSVRFADGTNVYVDADTGAVLALRTRQWRAFDWMWGLHIMDLSGREDTSHPILIGSAILALIATLAGLILLPLSIKRRR